MAVFEELSFLGRSQDDYAPAGRIDPSGLNLQTLSFLMESFTGSIDSIPDYFCLNDWWPFLKRTDRGNILWVSRPTQMILKETTNYSDPDEDGPFTEL